MGHAAEGPTGGGSGGLSPLAGGGATEAEAETFWCPPPFPAGDPRRANEERSRFGLCLEGGDTRPWQPIPAGWDQGEGGGLERGEGAGGGRPILGDRPWHYAQVRRLWAVDLTVDANHEWELIDYSPWC